MEKYDLSVITRDKLHLLLRTAKEEIEKFSNYHEEAEKIKKLRKERRESMHGCLLTIMPFSILTTSLIVFWIFSDYKFSSLLWVHSILFIVSVLLIIFWEKFSKEYDEAQLLELSKKEFAAKAEFKAVLFIPDDYCNKYALAVMLKYIENKRADNWKEVTGLYEEHLHRMTMENNTRQIIEEQKIQTEYLSQIRNRTGWATAGTWAAAAGIWNN